ncbi:MAG: hypothetical protein ACR2FJ_02025 [Qipengyuania sp.]
MNSLLALAAPMALVFSGMVGDGVTQTKSSQLTEEASAQDAPKARAPSNRRAPSWVAMAASYLVPAFNQVRIEQRVILRISPRPSPVRQSMMADMPTRSEAQPRFLERDFGDCLPMASIGAVRAQQGDRLLLYLNDRRLILAQLEKACSSRDFYSGFYVERSGDGSLCVDRDKLLSRSGAKCSVSGFSQLVPAGS